MQIDLPDDIGLTAQEVKREIAIILYQREAVSLAKAATLSDMTRLEFQRLPASCGIPIHGDAHDIDADIRSYLINIWWLISASDFFKFRSGSDEMPSQYSVMLPFLEPRSTPLLGGYMSTQSSDASSEDTLSMSRLLAFSDGVFAIAITLLVLNLHIPVLHAHQTLLQALANQSKEYLSYALSFLLIGQVWINHRTLFHLIARPTHRILILNIFLLLTIAILPFPTALLALYLGTASQQTAIAIFAALLLAAGLIYNGVWWTALADKAINPHLTQEQIELRTKRSRRRPLLYLLAFALAFVWQGQLSLIMCAGLTILFYFPQFSEHAPQHHSTHVSIPK